MTFEAYFRRYESIFEKDLEKWPDEKKARLLLGKFEAVDVEKYVNFILLRQPSKVTFRKTIQILTKIFGEQCWQCLKLTKKDCEDYTTFASRVNRYCERFKLNEITPDMFKCLIFVQGLTSPSEKEVRTRLLTKLEQDHCRFGEGKLFKRQKTGTVHYWTSNNWKSTKKIHKYLSQQ